MDKKIGWCIMGVPYIVRTSEAGIERVYILKKDSQTKKSVSSFIKKNVQTLIEECKNPILSSYFITYENSSLHPIYEELVNTSINDR